MLGLLGVGVALILGVAIRPAAIVGAVMLAMMWAAVWVPAKMAGGQPSGSTNPIVDEHIVGIFGFIVLAVPGYLGRRVPRPEVGRHPDRRGPRLAALRMAADQSAARRPAGQRFTPPAAFAGEPAGCLT